MTITSTTGAYNDVEILSATALDAAIELDRVMRHETPDLDRINRFSDELVKIVKGLSNGDQLEISADVAQMMALTTALGAFSRTQVSTVDELFHGIADVAARIKVRSVNSDSDEVPRALRDFCLGLHKQLLSSRGPRLNESENESRFDG